MLLGVTNENWGYLRLDYQGTTSDGHANLAVQTDGGGSFNVAQILVRLDQPIPLRAIRRALLLSAQHQMMVRMVITRPGGFSG